MRFFLPSFRTHSTLSAVVLVALGATACGSEAPAPAVEHEHVGHTAERWDSQGGNPTHATHSYLTEYAVDHLSAELPELASFRATLIDGANRELHELPLSDPFEEELRVAVGGTNWGADHPEVAWTRARAAYAAGDKGMAYWYVGVILHYVEDMGVPAHAFHVLHQGTFTQRDNFELLGLQRWSPSFASINVSDPGFRAPSDYVAWSGSVSADHFHRVFPGQTYNRLFFSSSWLWISRKQATFFHDREGTTAMITAWALESAVTNF